MLNERGRKSPLPPFAKRRKEGEGSRIQGCRFYALGYKMRYELFLPLW
jgi:hypothetical protein